MAHLASGKSDGLRDMRPSLRTLLEGYGITRKDQIGQLQREEIEEIRSKLEYIEKNPQLSDKEIQDYFRQSADLRNSIADSIGESGRASLELIKKNLPKS